MSYELEVKQGLILEKSVYKYTGIKTVGMTNENEITHFLEAFQVENMTVSIKILYSRSKRLWFCKFIDWYDGKAKRVGKAYASTLPLAVCISLCRFYGEKNAKEYLKPVYSNPQLISKLEEDYETDSPVLKHGLKSKR